VVDWSKSLFRFGYFPEALHIRHARIHNPAIVQSVIIMMPRRATQDRMDEAKSVPYLVNRHRGNGVCQFGRGERK